MKVLRPWVLKGFLSSCLASKEEEVEERGGYKLNKPNNKAGFKRKVNNPGSSSKRVVDNRVVINVGLITENEEGNSKIRRLRRKTYGEKFVKP